MYAHVTLSLFAVTALSATASADPRALDSLEADLDCTVVDHIALGGDSTTRLTDGVSLTRQAGTARVQLASDKGSMEGNWWQCEDGSDRMEFYTPDGFTLVLDAQPGRQGAARSFHNLILDRDGFVVFEDDFQLDIDPTDNLRTVIARASTSASTKAGKGSATLAAVWPVIPLAGACRIKIAACEGDVMQAYTDCLAGCDGHECNDCCEDKFDSDIVNCYATCGLNGPDGDYGTCWTLYNDGGLATNP